MLPGLNFYLPSESPLPRQNYCLAILFGCCLCFKGFIVIKLIMLFNFILYVRDQEASMRFYQNVLNQAPHLHVPGMTEFQFSGKVVLGLMPEKGIKRILGTAIEDPERSNGVARAEVYLTVETPEIFLERALAAGARLLSPLEPRNWGDTAAYVADPDGHVVAFASRTAF